MATFDISCEVKYEGLQKASQWYTCDLFNQDEHREGARRERSLPRLGGKLLVEGQLHPLHVVAELDGGSQLQVHTLLDCGQVEQQQRLAVDLLGEKTP